MENKYEVANLLQRISDFSVHSKTYCIIVINVFKFFTTNKDVAMNRIILIYAATAVSLSSSNRARLSVLSKKKSTTGPSHAFSKEQHSRFQELGFQGVSIFPVIFVQYYQQLCVPSPLTRGKGP